MKTHTKHYCSILGTEHLEMLYTGQVCALNTIKARLKYNDMTYIDKNIESRYSKYKVYRYINGKLHSINNPIK